MAHPWYDHVARQVRLRVADDASGIEIDESGGVLADANAVLGPQCDLTSHKPGELAPACRRLVGLDAGADVHVSGGYTQQGSGTSLARPSNSNGARTVGDIKV
jgi:hypothetical protein